MPRHVFANGSLWRSSRAARIKYTAVANERNARLILPVRFSQALACAPHLIRGATPHPRHKNAATQNTTTQQAAERCTKRAAKVKAPLDLRSCKPSKSAFLKFPLRADRKNQLFKNFLARLNFKIGSLKFSSVRTLGISPFFEILTYI